MKRIFSIIALILVLLMLLTTISGVFISAFSTSAATVDSVQSELDAIAKKREQLEKELAVINDKKEKELEKKSLIDEQINATNDEISALNKLIDSLDDDLDAAKEELDRNRYILFRKQLNSDIAGDVKRERFYRYMTSTFVTKHRRVYDHLLEHKNVEHFNCKEAYARFMCYSLIDLNSYRYFD